MDRGKLTFHKLNTKSRFRYGRNYWIRTFGLNHFFFFFIALGFLTLPVEMFADSLQSTRDRFEIRGQVVDNDQEPLIGVTVRSKGNRYAGGVTDVDGKFVLFVEKMDDVLILSYIGMETKEVPLKEGTTYYNVVMKVSDTQLKDVVVEAGIMQFDRTGFTGSYTQVTQEELKNIGNINLLQSLQAFDPGFNLLADMQFGSNPNVMSVIDIRGGSTLDLNTVQTDAESNPNAPLFILDGFEASLEEINDLNINMVESLTLLKDAASTAIYGAKGGNGVIIIETIKPKDGKVQLRYDGVFQVATPDLSVYNMMNAYEKLTFEVLAGRYGDYYQTENGEYLPVAITGDYADEFYSRQKKVLSGIDTYWLAEPVRTGISQTHSLNITGGDRKLMFQAYVSYRNLQGVMKESDRESYTGKMTITYRPTSNFIAQNSVSLQGTNAYDGPWTTGSSFQDYVNASPYYSKKDEEGNVSRLLDEYETNGGLYKYKSYNPLYNTTLKSQNDKQTFTVRNNTDLNWYVNDHFRVNGKLGLFRETFSAEYFKDPGHTDYMDSDYTRRGEYKSTHSTKWSYDGNINLAYNRVFNGHSVTVNGRSSIKESNYTKELIIAQGFPIGAPVHPEYAYSYKENSRPEYSKTKSREVSFIASAQYNYASRYLFDFSINREGNNQFGNKNKFQTFFSGGLGWNLHKEAFTEDWSWLDLFKLRGNYGTNAVQTSIGNVVTSSVYKYQTGYNIFGLGSYLSSFGNPYFQWQKVKKTTLGLDLQSFNNRLNLRFDLYNSDTDPQAISLPVKSSSGMTSYPINMGSLNTRGLEFGVTVTPINNVKERINLNFTINGSHNKTKYDGFGDALNQLNDEFLNIQDNVISNLRRFEDGRSPGDIWAVRSLGIDPATGREVFLKKDGTPTYSYRAEDRVVVGNSTPDLRGFFLLNFTYKQFRFSTSLEYSIGGERFNNDLYQKVENITGGQIMYNQDKRALYDRWKQPGDVAQFKAIGLTSTTQLSSRFVQKDTYLKGKSIQLSYDFSREKWVKHLGMQDLTLRASMNDLFTWSTMKVERGTIYPFERSFSIELSTRF